MEEFLEDVVVLLYQLEEFNTAAQLVGFLADEFWFTGGGLLLLGAGGFYRW